MSTIISQPSSPLLSSSPDRNDQTQKNNSPPSKLPSIFDLEHQFLFYGQYHSNPVNILVHVVCVPAIFFTSLILVHSLSFFPSTVIKPLSFQIPEWVLRTGIYGPSGTIYEINLSTLTTIGYSLYFMILEPLAASILSVILISFGHWSNLFYLSDSTQSIKIALIIFTISWVLQFIGHGKFEKRAPALIDNLFQSLVLALLFVWIEVWFYFGYRPELQIRLKAKIHAAIQEYKNRKQPLEPSHKRKISRT